MALPSPEELDAMMAADGGGSSSATAATPLSFDSGSSLPSPDQIQAMMDAEATNRTPLTGGEAFSGGVMKLLNSLTLNLGDEATSGVNAVIDSAQNSGIINTVLGQGSIGSSYDARLKQARGLDEHFNAQEPEAALALGLGGFLMPLPNSPIVGESGVGAKLFGASKDSFFPNMFSQAEGLLPAVGNVAKAGGVAATYGAGYGFGSGEGEDNRLKNAGIGALLGAVLGVPLQAGVEGVQGTGRGISAIKNIFSPNLDEKAAQIATDTVSQYTDTSKLVQKLKNIPAPDELTGQMTTAEQVRDPGLGMLTQVLEKQIPEVAITKEAMDTQRAMNRNAIFTDPQGVLYTPEKTGNILQSAISEGADAMGAKVSEAYQKAYEGEGTAPIFPAKRAVSRALSQQAKTGIAVDSNTQTIIDNFRALPNHLSMEELQGQRQIVGQLLGDLRTKGGNASVGEKAGLRVLSQLFGHIDNAEKFALTPEAQGVAKNGTQLGFSGEQGKAIENARALAAQKGELFQSGAAGKITAPDRYNDFKLQGSDVPRFAISSPEDARQIVDALKMKTPEMSGPDAKSAFASNLMETLRDRASNPVSNRFEASRFASNWDKMEPVAKEVLSSTQIKAINRVRDDLVGEANFKASVGNASKGQSITAQNLGAAAFVKDTISQAARNKVGIVGKFLSSIGEGRQAIIESKVDEILTKMSFDPKFTEMFLSRPTPQNIQKLTSSVLLQLAGAVESEATSRLGPTSQSRQPEARMQTGTLPQKTAAATQSSGRESSALATLLNSVLSPAEAQAEELNSGQKHSSLLAEIKADPFAHATALTESAMNPKAKNKDSSASGLFQLTKATAKSLGVQDVFDGRQNYDGFKKLTAENAAALGTTDPATLYAAHVLGAPLAKRWLTGKSLSENEAQLVHYFLANLPRFQRNLNTARGSISA